MKTPEEIVKQAHKGVRRDIAAGGGFENCAFIKIPRTGTQSINTVLKQRMGHRTAWEWRHRYKDRWDDLFKFTVVRNPYTRFVSAYHHARVKPHIDDFVANIGDMPKEFEIIFKPQYLFVYENDTLLVDKVYKFENLKEAWKDISERIGARQELPHLHKTKVKKAVLNDKSKRILAECYKVDFERFGYAK